MASRTIQEIEFDEIIDEDELLDLGEDWMMDAVANIRRGKVITRGYKPATRKARKRHGLQTAFIDLTGNKGYSRKGWRLLDSWTVRARKTGRSLVVSWKSTQARTLYGYIQKRFGDIF